MKLLINLILIISIDTLRYDALPSMPTTSQYLQQFQQVEQCWTPVPLTLPAHASLLSGLYPYQHGLRNNGNYKLNNRTVYLPHYLQGQGYHTAAFISSKVLSAKYGLGRGFEVYTEPPTGHKEQSASVTITQCLEYLQQGRKAKPRFVFLHLYDPHAPYQGYGKVKPNTREAYYAEVSSVDQELSRLWRFLDEQKLWSSSIVVFTSDHGEDLGDHGEYQHGVYLYNSTMRVPFYLYTPQQVTLRQTGSLIDLAPTLLDILGLEKHKEISGRSLLRPSQEPIFLESRAPYEVMRWSEAYGLVWQGWKYVEGNGIELYSLQDGREQQNRASEFPERVKQYKKKVWQLTHKSGPIPPGDSDLTSLGYLNPVQHGQVRTPDRKDQQKVLEALHWCYIRTDQGRYDQVLKLAQQGLHHDPGNPALNFYLLTSSLQLNEKLSDEFVKGLRPDDDDSGATAYMLGQYHEKQGLTQRAQSYYEQARRQNPLFIEPSLSLMMLALTEGRVQEAQQYVDLLRKHGQQEEAGLIAEVLWRFYQGNPQQAFVFLEKIRKELQHSPRYWLVRGYILSLQNNFEGAFKSFQKSHELGFLSPDFLLTWASITLEINKFTKARQLFEEFMKRYPHHKEADNVREILQAYTQP